MGKIKRHSLKWSLIKYLLPCMIALAAGILFIGHGTNYLQNWYLQLWELQLQRWDSSPYNFTCLQAATYWIISNAQVILMPLWTLFCVGVSGSIFYHFELKQSLDILLSASQKISENQLDFTIECPKDNELGELCQAFEDMRSNLYNTNLEMWHSLEERKRLNAAFSHDLRIPLTVLHGYVDFLQKYVPAGKVSEEKLMDVLSLMSGQVLRLEHYTVKMNSLQKLDDIIPNPQNIPLTWLKEQLLQTGSFLCSGKNFELVPPKADHSTTLSIDTELVMQVYENILSNAVRYAKEQITAAYFVTEDMLCINICDDGEGFSEEALEKADAPFFRDEKEEDKTHFGLGLYICRVLCEKCGGKLLLSNCETGGKVTAKFFCKEISHI